jgi:hypothetical protein
MVFKKAQTGPANFGDPESRFTVQYFDEKGNMTIRSEGSRAWRCNNPGAIVASKYSTGKDRRSIGIAGYGEFFYAVYPDYATGHEALVVMLRGSQYFHLTLREVSQRYVKKDPDHIYKVTKISKLDPDRTVKSLSNEEFERYWKAIEQNENWDVGREDPIPRSYISGIHKKCGAIYEYRIVQEGKEFWLSKNDAVTLAKSGGLHAIIVHLKNGSCYLRPEYHAQPFSSMVV